MDVLTSKGDASKDDWHRPEVFYTIILCNSKVKLK
jgi:hypothetical protein